MRIGLVIGLHDADDRGSDPPRWDEISAQVRAGERAGFDIAVFEDALTFAGRGSWEAMTMVGGLAAVTDTIELSHSVVNAATRLASVIAWSAATLDEISGGRYTLGIGAGNTPEDFEAFAVPVDAKFSRFEESLAVIRSLLRDGSVDFDGEFQHAHAKRFAPTGSRAVPIVVAGKGPRVLRMAARYGDGWNWWGYATDPTAGVAEILDELVRACDEVGRDPATLRRTLDLYSYDILGTMGDGSHQGVVTGSPSEMAESILSVAELGIDEVRCDVVTKPGQRVAAAEAMAEVVELVQAG
ncbi:MAG: LLM class flavin-dependent oxidoreductase [Acidimicrobiia bacterium]|nr:LLM class flavin-dependent oxidoreductase [Acidimicrobiia bacterium]MDH3470914.1 LLM class flavin-dependent oxidoreductase [Acidimicrobiia bacterium]